MNQTSPSLIPMGVLTLVAMVLLAAAVTRVMLARQRAARRRVVEKPNSEYAWEAVQKKETANRWAGINLDALHEINRDEVRRLLARVEAAGVDSLRPAERSFLDSLVSA